MVLVPVTEDNVEAYLAFIFEEADADGREFLATIDVRGAVLRRRQDHFYLEDGRPAASLSIDRKERPDGSLMISLGITPKGGAPGPLLAALTDFLAAEERTAPQLRRYRLSAPPEVAMPAAELEHLGFHSRPGRVKFVRDPGPPKEGEFPGAEAALAKGYSIAEIDEAMIAANPALFATVTEIFNRGFAGQVGISAREEAVMRERLLGPGCGTLLAMKGAAVTGYMHFTKLAKEVLVGEYASARRHWGTGSVDLMCRRMAALVDERWGGPIVGYAEVTNAPSCAAMERAGMHRAEEYPVWEYRLEAGAEMGQAATAV